MGKMYISRKEHSIFVTTKPAPKNLFIGAVHTEEISKSVSVTRTQKLVSFIK